jgi:hypothetical protein
MYMPGERGEAPRRETFNIAELRRSLEIPVEPTVPEGLESAVPQRAKDSIDSTQVHNLAELRRLTQEAMQLADDPSKE